MSLKTNRSRTIYAFLFLFFSLLVLSVGCQKKPGASVADEPPPIPVAKLVEREVIDYSDYTGRTDAVLAVNVRARATGYLIRTRFEEGAEVKEGDLLFEIDPQPYQIQVDSAVAQVKSAQAAVKSSQATVDSDKLGLAQGGGVVSNLQRITDEANLEGAQAKLDQANSALKNAKLNLSFTRVEAQISGQISRYYYTPGNLITQDQTLLTTIVSTDSMYAYFDIEEGIYERIIREISNDKKNPQMSVDSQAIRAIAGGTTGLTQLQRANFPILMAIEGKTDFEFKGHLDFLNNQVNPSTGTVAARGFFRNKRQNGGLATLIPGMFVRIRIQLGNSHKSQLIIDRAIGSDQGLKFVYVVDAENKVQYRPVVLGALQDDGLRAIEPYKARTENELESGVKPDEWVVVGGLQQLKPRSVIQPDAISMPTLASDAAARKSSGSGKGEKNAKGGGKK
ncbi:MAG TPA: efflux RND transporter periplasmic adaptor subunit [Gemmata sp.]|jgi:multidrug efflux system membrane fusion protein|nr:efflux RND transporter periplasmic adaptor subunit [Gemmata sp.]